jgi:hypothetical protein
VVGGARREPVELAGRRLRAVRFVERVAHGA